jgi:hypothetical protein
MHWPAWYVAVCCWSVFALGACMAELAVVLVIEQTIRVLWKESEVIEAIWNYTRKKDAEAKQVTR